MTKESVNPGSCKGLGNYIRKHLEDSKALSIESKKQCMSAFFWVLTCQKLVFCDRPELTSPASGDLYRSRIDQILDHCRELFRLCRPRPRLRSLARYDRGCFEWN
jgi:hypothetical protein